MAEIMLMRTKLVPMSSFNLALLFVLIGAQIFWRPFVALYVRTIFWSSVFGDFVALSVLSYFQYQTWMIAAPSKFLLPPYQSSSYFLTYAGARFFAPYIISLIVAIIFLWMARSYNRRHSEQFFYLEEYYFLALGIFFAGQPGWIFYLFFLFIIAFFAHIGIAAVRRTSDLAMTNDYRFSFYYFWLPVAVFVILIMQWLQQLSWFTLLKP